MLTCSFVKSHGTYAQYVDLPARQVYKPPNDFDFHNAAAAALVYQTARHSMVKRGNVQAGETAAIINFIMCTLEDFSEVINLVTTGKLKPVLDETFSLEDAANTQEKPWRGHTFGKITLNIE